MKVLILIWYFFRSLLLRGPFASFRILLSESKYDNRFGIRTGGFKRSQRKQEHHYQGAAYHVLLPLLKEAHQLCPQHLFYDIGCGKGRVLCVAEHCGFGELIGIEIDKTLLQEAEQNLALYAKSSRGSTFRLLEVNALEHKYSNQSSVYFLFNPFDAETLGKFLDRISELNKKEKFLIYMNPVYKQKFTERDIPIYKTIKTGFYTEAIIYRLKPEF